MWSRKQCLIWKPMIYVFHLNSCYLIKRASLLTFHIPNPRPLLIRAFPVARCICSNLHNVQLLFDLFRGDTNLCYDTLHATPSWQLPSLLFIGSSYSWHFSGVSMLLSELLLAARLLWSYWELLWWFLSLELTIDVFLRDRIRQVSGGSADVQVHI